MAIHINDQITLQDDEVTLEFVRASGPGGQNVNKVATAVKLYFDLAGSPSLPEPVRRRLARLAGKRLNSRGILVIDARRFRTQEQNRHDAIDRLAALIRQAATPPKPRFKTKPSRASQEKRIESKKKRTLLKRSRGKRGFDLD